MRGWSQRPHASTAPIHIPNHSCALQCADTQTLSPILIIFEPSRHRQVCLQHCHPHSPHLHYTPLLPLPTGCHVNGGNIIQGSATLLQEDLVKNGYADSDSLYKLIYGGKGRMPGFGQECAPKVGPACFTSVQSGCLVCAFAAPYNNLASHESSSLRGTFCLACCWGHSICLVAGVLCCMLLYTTRLCLSKLYNGYAWLVSDPRSSVLCWAVLQIQCTFGPKLTDEEVQGLAQYVQDQAAAGWKTQ